MYNKIQKHGDNLKAIFNLDIDSVKLCKQLFRLENEAHRLAEDYCNGITENIESEIDKIIDKVKKILNTNEVFFNGEYYIAKYMPWYYIPANILISITLTLGSPEISLNAFTNFSGVAPPPTSKKLAGCPPAS